MPEPQTGRIGGGVLKDNLERQGVNLNFKNTSSDIPLLHLDVNSQRIGINSAAPTDALMLTTPIRSTNLVSTYNNIAISTNVAFILIKLFISFCLNSVN